MILLLDALIWPVVILACVLIFRKSISNVLNSADEAEIGPLGLKWHRSPQGHQTETTQALAPAQDSENREDPQ